MSLIKLLVFTLTCPLFRSIATSILIWTEKKFYGRTKHETHLHLLVESRGVTDVPSK